MSSQVLSECADAAVFLSFYQINDVRPYGTEKIVDRNNNERYYELNAMKITFRLSGFIAGQMLLNY